MRKVIIFILIGTLTSISVMLPGCKKKKLNIFSLQDDINLGRQLEAEIAANPQEFPILPESQYPQAYDYIRGLRDSVLNTGTVKYKNEFDWNIYIIDSDVLNAFCAPGGYIYFYTGLIKFLDTEDELMGVLGHEIAHADRRHSTSQLTKQYGIGTLLSVLTGGDPGTLAQIAAGLISLKFSRTDETEADEYSVRYLCPTTYNAAGAAGFFTKIEDVAGPTPPQFLSTHPNPGNRVQAINQWKADLACSGNQVYDTKYQQFKAMLP